MYRRAFSTTKILPPLNVPCISCKHYNIENGMCNAFVSFDPITGNKITHPAQIVRNDENKCGIIMMKKYEPVLKDLENELTTMDNSIASRGPSFLGIGIATYSLCLGGIIYANPFASFVGVGMGFYMIFLSSDIIDLESKKTQIKSRIDLIHSHPKTSKTSEK